MKPEPPADIVISFEEVSLRSPNDDDHFSLSLSPGELAILECPRNRPLPDITGLTLGLKAPVLGTISYRGTAWTTMTDENAENHRRCSGVVFNTQHRAGWLENLDVDENVCLAQLTTTAVSRKEVLERALALAQRFGLSELPRLRSSKVPRQDLLRAQWVRAFLPKPLRLLILERPVLGMPPDAVSMLVEQIHRVRDDGSVVLWVDLPRSEIENAALAPTIRCKQLCTGLLADD